MEPHERQLVLDRFASSEARLLQLVEGLTAEQWSFRQTPGRWSIAENIEHVVNVEKRILGAIEKMLDRPAEPDKRSQVEGKVESPVEGRDAILLSRLVNRTQRLEAPEPVRPTGKWPDTNDLMAELRNTRARSMQFAGTTDGNLRDHFFPHVAFGVLDCYQWLIVLSLHGARHALQIEEIKSDPAFPSTQAKTQAT